MKSLIVLLLLLAGCAGPPTRDTPLSGSWLARVMAGDEPVWFDLELQQDATGWHATVVNGEERIEVPVVTATGGAVTLDFPHYDSRIEARLSRVGTRLEGAWRKRRAADSWCVLPFVADAREASRWHEAPPWSGTERAIAGRWAVRFESSSDPAVGEFHVTPEGEVRGTFLTTTGDYRYLAGRFTHPGPTDSSRHAAPAPTLRLSCFDGAHAFRFTARVQPDGSLAGDFWSGDRWHETWTATRDEHAALPDAFSLARATGAVSLNDLVFPDLDGTPCRLSDPQFAGKARILEVFGSWCPNCADAAAELVQLQQEYGPRGLAVIGLAFEVTGDFARDAAQVRRYAERHGITWPLLVAGLSDKDKATASLGLLDRVVAYPTLIFLDEAGTVRAVYTGFSGPATGEAYAKQHAEFVRVIEELLGS
jgi:thiol-disulfide isomerase/thioredoxin